MNTANKTPQAPSAYGTAFIVRMVVLLGVLGIAVGGFFYDRQVLIPNAEKAVKDVQNLMSAETDDGGGIHQSQVHETIGSMAYMKEYTHVQEPSEKVKADKARMEKFAPKTYQVEQYTFKRILPFFMEGQTIDVAYLDKTVVFCSAGDPITEEQLNRGFEKKIEIASNIPEEMRPSAAGGGGGGGQRNNSGNDDDKGSDDKGSDDKGSDDKGSDDKGSDDKGSDDKGSDDKDS